MAQRWWWWTVVVVGPMFGAEEPFAPKQAELPAPAPKDAIIVFDGARCNFVSMAGSKLDWSIVNGELVSHRNGARSNHACSLVRFRDADIHVEFMIDPAGEGNNGVYLHGHYEMQILNTPGKGEVTMNDAGALYAFAKPLVNAARPPGQWQVYDIRYRAPRRGADGGIVEEGSVTAWLNGQKVQDQTRFGEPRSKFTPYKHGVTPYLKSVETHLLKTGVGPFFLQDHDSPTRFRNVWVRPLDDQARVEMPPTP